ncbi:MAG: hypothetical protein V1740_05970 [Candidatus Woesearchaeota archaeon]
MKTELTIMVIYPFRGRGAEKNQKIISIIMIIISLFILTSSTPFIFSNSNYAIPSSIIGGILLISGLLYFLDVTL